MSTAVDPSAAKATNGEIQSDGSFQQLRDEHRLMDFLNDLELVAVLPLTDIAEIIRVSPDERREIETNLIAVCLDEAEDECSEVINKEIEEESSKLPISDPGSYLHPKLKKEAVNARKKLPELDSSGRLSPQPVYKVIQVGFRAFEGGDVIVDYRPGSRHYPASVDSIPAMDWLRNKADEAISFPGRDRTEYPKYPQRLLAQKTARRIMEQMDESEALNYLALLEIARFVQGNPDKEEQLRNTSLNDISSEWPIAGLGEMAKVRKSLMDIVEPELDAYTTLDFELLPPESVEREVWVSAETDSIGVPEVGDIRRQIIIQLRDRWMEQGYDVATYRCPEATDNTDSFRDYLLLTRTNEDGVSDAVAVSTKYGEATYALRGDEFDWRSLFRLHKSEFRKYIDDYNVGQVIINDGSAEETVQAVSYYLDDIEALSERHVSTAGKIARMLINTK